MDIKTIRKIFVPLAVLATFSVNMLANIVPVNGQTTLEIFQQFKIYFSPADYAFNIIRGAVYFLWIGFSIYQFLPKKKEDEERLNRIFPYFLLICGVQTIWIFLWHYEMFVFTLFVMLILFRLAVQISYILYIDKQSDDKVARVFMYAPFSVYLGWITLVTVANATGLLWLIGWGEIGFFEGGWASLMIVLLGLLSAGKILRDRDGFFPAVIILGVVSIYVKFPEVDTIRYAVVIATLVAGIAALYKSLRIIKEKKEINY